MAKIRGWKFPVEVDKTTGRFMTIEDNENVKQSIKLILQTERTERKMRPTFGTRINQFMFDNIDISLVNNMAREIGESIEMWEDHIEDLQVDVSQAEDNISSVIAEIKYITDMSPEEESIVKVFDSDYKMD